MVSLVVEAVESFHLRRLKGRKESRIQSATVQTRGDGFAGMTKSLSPVGPNVACRNTVQELPIRLTSYIPIPKTPRTEPGKMTLHYCQRTTASGDCRLRPAGAERNRFGNAISGWAGRPYVSMGERPIEFTTSGSKDARLSSRFAA